MLITPQSQFAKDRSMVAIKDYVPGKEPVVHCVCKLLKGSYNLFKIFVRRNFQS
jgi:hypothetical protein